MTSQEELTAVLRSEDVAPWRARDRALNWSLGMSRFNLRSLVRVRDCGECQYCGVVCETENLTQFRLTIDHVIPMSRAGHPTHIDNLVVACHMCNVRKGNRFPWELGMWPLNGLTGVWMDMSCVSPPEAPLRHEMARSC